VEEALNTDEREGSKCKVIIIIIIKIKRNKDMAGYPLPFWQ